MRGPSADSLSDLTQELGQVKGLMPRLAALAAKVTGQGDADGLDAGRTADDLLGAAEVLRNEASLRRTLTDASLPAEPKVGLVRSIFGKALAPASLDVLASAVSKRWSSPRDLPDALEHVGVVAVVRGAEQGDQADALESELFTFGQLVADNPELRDALSDPARSNADKQALVEDLLGGRATPGTVRLAQQSVLGTHRTVALAVEAYQKIAADHRQRLVATVSVAQELSAEDTRRLSEALAARYGLPVHVNTIVDPDVIGGMRVAIGDDVIDGSVANRLDDARRRLAG